MISSAFSKPKKIHQSQSILPQPQMPQLCMSNDAQYFRTGHCSFNEPAPNSPFIALPYGMMMHNQHGVTSGCSSMQHVTQQPPQYFIVNQNVHPALSFEHPHTPQFVYPMVFTNGGPQYGVPIQPINLSANVQHQQMELEKDSPMNVIQSDENANQANEISGHYFRHMPGPSQDDS